MLANIIKRKHSDSILIIIIKWPHGRLNEKLISLATRLENAQHLGTLQLFQIANTATLKKQ